MSRSSSVGTTQFRPQLLTISSRRLRSAGYPMDWSCWPRAVPSVGAIQQFLRVDYFGIAACGAAFAIRTQSPPRHSATASAARTGCDSGQNTPTPPGWLRGRGPDRRGGRGPDAGGRETANSRPSARPNEPHTRPGAPKVFRPGTGLVVIATAGDAAGSRLSRPTCGAVRSRLIRREARRSRAPPCAASGPG